MASGKGPRGWTGEPESDIPTQLFPKHVQVLKIEPNFLRAKNRIPTFSYLCEPFRNIMLYMQ
jgi:hypothetical protein